MSKNPQWSHKKEGRRKSTIIAATMLSIFRQLATPEKLNLANEDRYAHHCKQRSYGCHSENNGMLKDMTEECHSVDASSQK